MERVQENSQKYSKLQFNFIKFYSKLFENVKEIFTKLPQEARNYIIINYYEPTFFL